MKEFLFSIITPIYKTPIYKLERLYKSIYNQTYNNWEWIVYDDSPVDYLDSFDYIQSLNDSRIKLFKGDEHYGVIGKVKKKAFLLATGDVLVEVDHDDELVDTCLINLNTAYNYSDNIGFVYGHACEMFEDGSGIIDYGDNWAFGYGRYGKSIYQNFEYKVAMVSNINAKTIRHITGVPNHVRSWKSNVYKEIGGHSENLHVADDFELIVRTFLKTKMAKIDAFTYIQYFEKDHTNTQFTRNKDIHVLVPLINKLYKEEIHNKFLELGVDDYVWNNGEINMDVPNKKIESYANLIIPTNLLLNSLSSNDEMYYNKYAYSRVYDIPFLSLYKKTEHYSNLIKWIIRLTNCKSYLELGVQYGENILQIKDLVDLCVGVDTNYIDLGDKVKFYHMTTNDFFDVNNDIFDIIFIDANHQFEYVKHDFDKSLQILNKYGIIIIHDTDPIVKDLTHENYCHNSYQIVEYIQNNSDLNIITLPIQETGLTLVMRKNDRRINEFL